VTNHGGGRVRSYGGCPTRVSAPVASSGREGNRYATAANLRADDVGSQRESDRDTAICKFCDTEFVCGTAHVCLRNRTRNGISGFESRHPHHSVRHRTSLHFLTPQNDHFLGKRERLPGRFGSFGSNLGIPETEGRTKSPGFAGFSQHSASQILETALAGWGAWIRTRGWRNQNPLPYHLATPQRGRRAPV
jgi:hypothetical protein